MNQWFFIASPKTNTAEWEDIIRYDWGKHRGHTHWGIPDVSKDLENLEGVNEGDMILCYDAAPKTEIIGHCICDGRYNDGYEGFRNGIFIRDFNKYLNPIKFSELRKKGFYFINDFLGNNNGRGRSIVKVPEKDWDMFKRIYHPYTRRQY